MPALALRFEVGTAAGRTVPLVGRVTVGRSPENALVLAGAPTVSRHHAVIDCRPDGCIVHDAGSTHGTCVNGVRLTDTVQLRPGDRLAMGGEQAVVVVYTGPPGVSAPPSPVGPSEGAAVPPGGRPPLALADSSPTIPPTPALPPTLPPQPPVFSPRPATAPGAAGPDGPPPVPRTPPAPPRPSAAAPAGPVPAQAVPAAPRRRTALVVVLLAAVALVVLAAIGVGAWFLLRPGGPEVLAAREIAPGGEPQRLEYEDKLAVTVPPGAFGTWPDKGNRPGPWREPVNLTIAAADAPSTGTDKLRVLAAYDVSAGDDVLVVKPLEIEFSYDPKAIPSGRKPEHALLAASWDPVMETWVAVPCRVDAGRNRVVVQARHLSVYGLILQWWENVAQTEHFTICYDADELSKDVFVNPRSWLEKRLREGGQDPAGDERRFLSADVPPFVLDVGRMLEHAYRKYQLAGFKVPSTTWSRLTVFVETSGASQRSKLTGIITIACTTASPADYRLTTAHELFHSVQAEYFSALVPGYSGLGALMAMNYRTWWLETCAEYAAWHVAWDRNAAVARPVPKYLEEPLSREYDQTSPQHMYQNAVFLQYLEDRAGADFRQVWEDTVNRTRPFLGLERMSVIGYAAYELGLNWKPTEEWKRSVTLTTLENHFLAKRQTLIDHYRGMAGWLLFDASSPLTGVATGDDLQAKVVTKSEDFPADESRKMAVLAVNRNYAAAVWAVRVACDPPNGSRRLRVYRDDDPPTGTAVDVYVLPQNVRPAGGPAAAGAIAANNATREIWLDLQHGDVVYCVATSTRDKDTYVTVSIDTGVKLAVISEAIPRGLVNRQYRFIARATEIPRTVRSLELEWDWGDGSARASERRDPAPPFEADFQYMHAWNREKTYTLTVRLFDTSRGYRSLLAALPVKIGIGQELTLRIDPATMVAEPKDDVTFRALASKMPAGAQFEWTFGDGTPKVYTRDREVSHRYAREGTFTVEAVLVDTAKPRDEGELAAARAEAVIRKEGPVAIVVMEVQLHTGKSTSMKRLKGSDTTYMSFDFDQSWRFPKVQAQGLFFWGQGSEQIKNTATMTTVRTWKIKGQLTANQRAVELLELEETHETPLSGDDGRDLSRTRVVLRNIPLVRNEFGGMVCEVMGSEAAAHAPIVESTHRRESKYENYSFELDRNDIDWNALDRSRSLDKPIPAYVRVIITPTK